MDLRPNLVSIERKQTLEREKGRGKERRRGRGREEEEKRSSSKIKGMELTLGMNSSMDHMDFVWNSRKVYEFQT